MKRSPAFRNRAKSRIKEQYKPKSENNSRGIFEIVVALASMVGGIAAAISAFLSYRQIVLIDEQKLTPFQVAEYTEELQQFKNIDAAISEYISNGLAIRYSIKEIIGLNGSPELQKSMYKILRNNIKERLGESYKLRRTLSDNSSFWGSESLSLIADSIRATASDDKSGYCVRFSPDEHIVKCIENRMTIDSSLRQRLMSSLRRDMDEGRSR